MEIITLPRLRNAELQIVCESSLTICQPLTIIQEVREKVEKEFAPFKAGMLKVQASAGDKKNLDKERDRYVLGFFGNVKAEEYFPHEKKAAQNVVAELIKVVNKYGGKITRLPLNEETATIDNMIGEVDKLDLSSLSEANLLRWLPLIVNANNLISPRAVQEQEMPVSGGSVTDYGECFKP